MIICPKCKSAELDGTVFCSNCGTQLSFSDEITTHQIVTAETRLPGRRTTEPFQTMPPITSSSWISLHMIESGQIMPLNNQPEFTLGRASEGQPIMPDIDLTPYNAYANGVSRLHIVIKRSANAVSVTDLGSSNGTYVNSQRIDPNREYPLAHGDILSLGKLKIQVLLNMQAK